MNLLALTLICLLTLSSSVAELRLRDINKPDSKDSIPKKVLELEDPIVHAPWQVSVQNQHGNHICGGAIIDDKVVLTAASCVAALDGRDVRVITGTDNWMVPAAIYEVKEIIIHCNHDKPLYHNDVGLIKLKTSIAYDEKTQNITIANFDKLEEGEILTMTGWGSPEAGVYGDDVDLGHLCVLPEKERGACHGDTGGPLVNSEGQLVGIDNWGIPCGHGFPDVFARVAFYSDWIRSSIKGCSLQ